MDKSEQNGLGHFLRKGLWELDPDNYKGGRRYGIKCLQIVLLAGQDFWNDHCLLRSSALAFATILSLVPFLALAFAILKGFGVQNRVEPLILEQLSGGSQEVATRIIAYINNTSMASVGAFGLLSLLFTVITLIDNIEEAFNVVWGVEETRSLQRKFSDYLSVVVIGPILIFTAISMTTSLQSQYFIQWLVKNSYLGDMILHLLHLVPYLVIWIALVSLYVFIPNTKVRFRSALVGGVLAGTCWQLAQWGYIHFQVGVARYNAIYGTLAILPIFMVWIYTSWMIVLFGAEVVHAHQNIRTFRREIRTPAISYRLRELLALAIMQDVVIAFTESGRSCWTAERLADDLDLPGRVLRDLIHELVAEGFLVATADDPPCYQPAREPDKVLVKELLGALKDFGGRWQPQRLTAGEERLQGLLAEIEGATATVLDNMNLRDLAGMKQSGERASS